VLANPLRVGKRLILTWQLNKPFDINPLVIPAKAGIQQLQGFSWIPALRSAAAGMTSLVAGLILPECQE